MPEPLTDARVLRAIAHPLRSRILDELYAAGSLRAADLARLLDVPANRVSFHLRQLAKYGLIEEDPGAARDRRDRAWKAVVDRGFDINLSALSEQPGGKAAAEVWRRHARDFARLVVDHAFAESGEEGTFRAISDHTMRLTKDEAAELTRELDDVLQKWITSQRDADDERRTYLLYSLLQPYPELPAEDA